MRREEAERIVLEHLERQAPLVADSWAIFSAETRERPWGWVLVATSKRFLDGDLSAAIAGNGPLAVLHDGTVEELPFALDVDSAIKLYEAHH